MHLVCHRKVPTVTAPRPLPHQADALDAIVDAIGAGGRAQVAMACGTGKTLVGRWAAQRLDSRVVVVFCPSLALVAQTVRAWRSADDWHFEATIVCSDPTTACGAREREDGDPKAPWWARYGAKVTTNPVHVATALGRARPGRPQVIFSTYHSAHVVAQAVEHAGRTVDLAIADEAHHLAGSPRTEFRTVVDGTLHSERFLFMTATRVVTRVDGGLSMDDERTFGPLVHGLSFSDAIERKLLTDYQVVVYQAGSESRPSTLRDSALESVSAFVHGISGRPEVTSVLSYHGRVAKARAFAAELDGLRLPDGRTVVARAVAGTDSTSTRERALSVLDERTEGQVVLVASARCLAEGVDLPAVSAVLFADPRSSEVDIIQAVGRVLRTHPGKRTGTILLPLIVPDGIEHDVKARSGVLRHVWTVMETLRGMDSRFADELDGIERGESSRRASTRARLNLHLPSLTDLRTLLPQTAQLRTVPWHERIAAVTQFAAEHGHTRVPPGTTLGLWCETQRRARRAGLLDRAQIESLAAVPHWTWDAAEHRWLEQVNQVIAAGRLRFDDDEAMSQRITARAKGEPATVGQWCAAQRAAARTGALDPKRRNVLDHVPGWKWSLIGRRDAAHVDLLAEYVAWKRNANVPEDFVEGDLHLGAWLRAQRRARVVGTLSRAMLDEIEWATADVSTAEGRLRWLAPAVRWSLGMEALRQFVAREGHCRVPYEHQEALVDTSVQLYAWATRQRHLRRHGELPERLANALERIDGWTWEPKPAPRVKKDIGDTPHGIRTGYTKGCRCDPCTEAKAEYGRERDAALAAGKPTTDLVDAEQSRDALLHLLGLGASRNALARALAMNPKTVDEIIDGTTQRVLPATEERVLSCTMERVEAASSGLEGARVDAAATWALIEELLALGWPKAWIAREAGLGASLQLSRASVSRRNARRIAELHAAVGGRKAPPRERGVPVPALHALAA